MFLLMNAIKNNCKIYKKNCFCHITVFKDDLNAAIYICDDNNFISTDKCAPLQLGPMILHL